MSDPIIVAIVAAVPGFVAAVGAWRSTGLKQMSLQVARIEKKLDRHVEWHLGEHE